MKILHVNVSKPYDVLVGRGIFQDVPSLIWPECFSNRVAIITDDIVARTYLDELKENLEAFGYDAFTYEFPNGEQSKNIETLSDILEFLAVNHLRRNDTLIALGGGVVGDVAGLAGALYMRGIQVVHVPTTLLAAVDSSVGGKTAIDLKYGKNLAGAFWQPGMVICDVDIIEQLPDDIFAEGMAEVIKCNVIKGLSIIDWIEAGNLKEHLDEVIYHCVALKCNIVEQDEFDDKGIRNILNVGHTAAHAIERLSGYSISHGHAVGTGLVIEAEMAWKLGMCDMETVDRIRAAIDRYDLLVDLPWPSEEITTAMKSDKKNRDAQIVFELPEKLGVCKEIRIDSNNTAKLIEGICGG